MTFETFIETSSTERKMKKVKQFMNFTTSRRSCCLEDNVDVETTKFLQDIKYFRRLENEFPKVKIYVSKNKIVIEENGSSRQFDEVVSKCRRMLSEIEKSSVALSLGETYIRDVIACDEARDFIQNILLEEKVEAKVTRFSMFGFTRKPLST